MLRRIHWLVWCLLSLATSASASTGALTWTANTEADLAGYKIYRSTFSGQYGVPIATVGTVTSYTAIFPDQPTDQPYFFTITAYDLAGNESGKSLEVRKLVAGIPVVVPTATWTIIGDPTTGVWGASLSTTLAEPFVTEVWLNNALHHTESFTPRCLTEATGGACSTQTYPPGTYMLEARLLQNNVEKVRTSITVVVPAPTPPVDVPPVPPTGLTITKATPEEVIVTARLANCARVLTSTSESTSVGTTYTMRCTN